ncbi:hypothetical protein [Pedobacter sp. KLB.chiD]|uniref:hypothetical protein n=1 Tax=Pedobacter sp. KLB.chiD TaxID=3387402 RepID=UPI00399A27E7
MIKNKLFNIILPLSLTATSLTPTFSQVKIANSNGTANQGAILDVESTNRGFLTPRIYLNNALMRLNGVIPAEGTIIFSTNWSGDGNLGGLFIWKGGKWEPFDNTKKIVASHITVTKGYGQNLVVGNNDIIWESAPDILQPTGDSPMWSSSNPTKIIIRRKGLYFVSGSCRLENAVTGELRYFAILKNNQQTSGVGYNTYGVTDSGYRLTFNTSTTIYCEAGDEIKLTCFSANNKPLVAPGGLPTTRMSVTQISTRTN